MRISIKFKFSIFLAALLLLTVLILSLLVLEGIKRNQQVQVEQYLAQQATTANTFFIQALMSNSNKVPQAFLRANGDTIAEQLELIAGRSVALYDQEGKVLYPRTAAPISDQLQQTLDLALHQKAAYLTQSESLYYMTPLWAGNEQVGVVQFYYSLAANQAFYHQTQQLLFFIGVGVFILSFIIAYIYFNSFAVGIIRLNQTVDSIRDGQYTTVTLQRKDEMGELSNGIQAMSDQIRKTLQENQVEREKLSLAVQKLSQLDQQQKQFIGNITHEFKTPLTAIKAYMDLLDMYPDDEQLLETAKQTVQSETGRLYEMVEKVLKLSALEKYEFEFNKEKIDVKQAILTVLQSLSGKMEKFGIQLQTELSETSYVYADKDSMTIMLINLLDNAIKYNKANGTIQVQSYVLDGEVIIQIADTGIGIPAEVADKIFEAFFTVDKARSRESGGIGLGLSLAKKHAELHGGSIKLVHTGPGGSMFRLSFPAYT